MTRPDLSHIDAMLDEGRSAEARDALLRLARRRPDDPDLCAMLTVALGRLGERDKALYYAERASRLAPGDPNLLTNLGNMLIVCARPEDAERIYREAARIAPDHRACRVGVTHALFLRHRLADCVREGREFLARFPREAGLLLNVGAAAQHLGLASDAVATLREAAAANPDDLRALTGLANAVNYTARVTAREAFAAHEAYGVALERLAPHTLGPFSNTRDADRRIRVGLMSADLRSHACAFFAEAILRHLPRDRANLYCYMTGAGEDATSARLRGLGVTWRSVAHLQPANLAAAVRADAIDVLVEMSGHTAGHRLPSLHLGCAPVQATYFGYPNTTGVRAIGWRIVDSVTDPATPEFDSLATERLLRLDPCFLCYTPPERAPEVCATAPRGRTGADGFRGFTFGSFNAIAKIDDGCVRAWARILARTAGSRLYLKHTGLAQEESRALLADRFAREGVGRERLRLEGPAPDAAAMLPSYNEVDLALDTFPYNGTTTTCEALFMGAPVVTFPGGVCAARVSASILHAAGLPELVAPDEAGFVDLAAALAADPARLDALRAGLRARFLASAACDGPAFGRRFEGALRTMWARWCETGEGGPRG